LAASTQFSVDDINEPLCLYKDNEQEEVDPNALPREVESDEEEESRHDEYEFEEDDEDDDYLPVHAGRPRDRDYLPDHTSSATFPFFLTTRWRASIQQQMRRGLSYLDGIHVGFQEFPVPVWDLLFDMFMGRYTFTRLEDLPRARAVWESTAQTNLRKWMWEARDKAMKTTGNQDPMAWLDYAHIWLSRDYWESLCDRGLLDHGRSGHRRQNATDQLIRRRMCILHHELERAPTFRKLFDRTHKRKGTDDYVSESARTIAETYDRTMADRYAEGTPQSDLDQEAWVNAAGGPRKGRVYGFGDSLDTTIVLSSYASLVAPPAYASSSAVPPGSGVEEMRTLIWEELWTHFGVMVEQLISAMQGVRPSQPTPWVNITINFI
ncbi:hypothetical protein Taro_016103, partial [Colocasia esculenta]|nr:hypothetical protein [Colocasia esculenta]